MTTPTTAAGRDAVRMRGLFGGETEERATQWVLAIEAEARAAVLDEARVAVEALHAYGTLQDEQCLDVLAAIDALRERSGE